MNSHPQPIQVRKRRYLDDLREAVLLVADIDVMLGSVFGGKGRGIHSKLDSLRPLIPERLDKRLRYLEAARNKALAEREWRIPDPEGFIAECRDTLNRLQRLSHRRARVRHLWGRLCHRWGSGGSFAVAVAAMGLLLMLASGTISVAG